jgi:ribosomal protein L7/L12
MKRLDAEKMITLITNNFNDVDNITAGDFLSLLEEGIVDDQRLDEITARNNNRINDCMELVRTLFSKGYVDKIQAIMLVRVLKNVSLVDAKEFVDAWDTKCKHEWVAHVNGDIKCKHCPAINPEPIIEVWEKYKHLDGLFTSMFARVMWQAITKYAEGKEVK